MPTLAQQQKFIELTFGDGHDPPLTRVEWAQLFVEHSPGDFAVGILQEVVDRRDAGNDPVGGDNDRARAQNSGRNRSPSHRSRTASPNHGENPSASGPASPPHQQARAREQAQDARRGDIMEISDDEDNHIPQNPFCHLPVPEDTNPPPEDPINVVHNSFESDASALTNAQRLPPFEETEAHQRHVQNVGEYLAIRGLPNNGELWSDNLDTVWQHHLPIHALSLKNCARILRAYTDSNVDRAAGTRNHTKALRAGLKSSLPLLDPM
ncbi:hypothetical protein PG991_012136 [Apiospora marii]|uniref:Uncharacterized protein n=1 Tax=Apiospora marii TaxID=335849 RepID=A0ABR1R8W7_9PEZI